MLSRRQPLSLEGGPRLGLIEGATHLFSEPDEKVLQAVRRFEEVLTADMLLPPPSLKEREVEWEMLHPQLDEDAICLQLSYPDIWTYALTNVVEFHVTLLTDENQMNCECGIVIPCGVDFLQMAPRLFALIAASYRLVQEEIKVFGIDQVVRSISVHSATWQISPTMILSGRKAA